MSKRKQQECEKMLFRYSAALDRGDFETVARILHTAQDDPTLARMIDEINAVYKTEAVFQPTSSSLHSNNDHRNQKGQMMHTIYNETAAPQQARRWYSVSAPLVAAALAVVILGSLLLSARPGGISGTSGENNGGNNAQIVDTTQATPTPIPSSTSVVLATPTPMSNGLPIVLATPSPVDNTFSHNADIAPQAFILPNVLCSGVVMPGDGINLFSRPSVNGVVIGRIAGSTLVDILDQSPLEWGVAVQWYFVAAQDNEQQLQGWAGSEGVTLNLPCPMLSTPTLVPTPTAFFEGAFNLEGYPLILLQPVGDIAGRAAVRISSTWFDQNIGQRYYDVVDETGSFAGGVPEQYLTYAPGIRPQPTVSMPQPVTPISTFLPPTVVPPIRVTATSTPIPFVTATSTPIR